jgi:predicted N-acetyltransferase YhbS
MDMLVKLYDLPDSRALFARMVELGITVRRALAPEKHKVAAWVRENFSEGWASESEVAFSRQPVSCFIAVQDGGIVGFACHDATCRNFFGPTGVAPNARNNGVGTALLFACLEAMKQQGFGYAIIGGVGPADYYAKAVGAVPIEGSEPGIYRGLLDSPRFGTPK